MPAAPTARPERVIVFDLDDTLYLERDFVLSGFAAVGRWAKVQLGVTGLGETMADCFHVGVRGRVFDEALRRSGMDDAPDVIERMLRVYRQHDPEIALADDALRFFRQRSSGVEVAIITDGFHEAQKRKLRALRVHHHGVKLALCTDRWGRDHWKPSPRAFEYVEAFFGLSGAVLTYVADNPNKDFHAPKQLGWHTVQIDRPERLQVRLADHANHAATRVTSLDAFEM